MIARVDGAFTRYIDFGADRFSANSGGRVRATRIFFFTLVVGDERTLLELPAVLAADAVSNGYARRFDVLLEASGNERALRGALDVLRPRGIIVQVGLGGEMTLPVNTIVAKEFDLRGAFRFHQEFAMAVELLNKGLVDVKPLISATLPFRDDYADPATVAKNYFSTGGLWRVETQMQGSWLLSPGVKNNPLWLKASLPNDVAVEFDVKSMSPEGDIKMEIFGDGSDHASGYVLIHGGWNNSISIIARLDEHAPPMSTVPPDTYRSDTRVRVEANPFRVDIGKVYHWRVERRGKVISWSIDGQPFMRFEDPMPLTGKGHDRMAFSSWEAQLYFDNLSVTAL